MGASFITMRAKGTHDQVKEAFRIAQEDDRYHNGHSYSGGFGMCTGLTFGRVNRCHEEVEADEWLSQNCDKWGPAIALRLTDDEYLIGAWCAC